MRLRLHRIDLPPKPRFCNAKREISTQRTLVLELEQDGLRGHGEACEDLYYGASVEQIYEQLVAVRDKLEYYALADPAAFWQFMQPQLNGKPFAQCALDCAAHDLWGKMKGVPVWKLWGLQRDNCAVSSYSIGIDTLERIANRLNERPDWASYRIKLGTRHDLETLQFLRSKTTAEFYVDVNGAWTLAKALEMLGPMQELGVTLLEQPLNANDFEGMAKLKKEMKKRHINIPVFADESWKTVADIEKCAGVFDGINVKILKCGGLTPVRKLIEKVRKLGLKVASANTIESAIGAGATAQIAPLVDYIGVDGPLHVDKKIGHSIRLDKGQIRFPAEGGTGVRGVVLR